MNSKQEKTNVERWQFWQMVNETWRDSDTSVRKLCQAEGLSEGTFYNWRKILSNRRTQRKGQSNANVPAFIEVAAPKSGRDDYLDAGNEAGAWRAAISCSLVPCF
jgi:hypothetical protein